MLLGTSLSISNLSGSSSLYDEIGLYSYYENEFEEESNYLKSGDTNYGPIEDKDYSFKHYLANRANYDENLKRRAKMILNERNFDKRILKSLTK